MADESKTVPALSDEKFKDYLLDLIQVAARLDVNGRDQIEALTIALISCAISQLVNPADLLFHVSKQVHMLSAKIGQVTESIKKGEPSDLDQLLPSIKGSFKN